MTFCNGNTGVICSCTRFFSQHDNNLKGSKEGFCSHNDLRVMDGTKIVYCISFNLAKMFVQLDCLVWAKAIPGYSHIQ